MSVDIHYHLLFFVLIISQISPTHVPFRLYHSDQVSDSELYHDCLLYQKPAYPTLAEFLTKKNRKFLFVYAHLILIPVNL